ncbi:protein FAM8A1 [Eurytemora carolleeae]|uniref:protein FAM8A1 n=1 Tax=Eurytemora carolleeae TaxID=1294199 RepID=UPI000C7625AE|nr:protein FAM8A1 [Eurytemora carolleeae]|eukprot:XP_023319896.1 protein FAM8A1-like [Eurytemora affinis]
MVKEPVSRAAYAAEVQEWLQQAHQAQALQLGFYTFLSQQANLSITPGLNQPQSSSTNPTERNTSQSSNNTRESQGEQRIYTIPPIWKRIIAELLDIFILFTLKVVITFTAVDFFEVIELENYDFLNLANTDNINIETLDYNAAIQFTSELLILELVHRLVVCVFEALCTHRGQRGMIGGATPGKVIMGLKIVKCEQIVAVGGSRVVVIPGDNLGIWWALVRSFIKNLSLAVFFPICISLLLLPNSRTIHDVMSKSIVVENEQQPNRN